MLARTRRTAAIVGLAAALCATLTTGTATADPVFSPDANDIVGVGSETSQYVINSVAAAYTAGHPDVRLASFNGTKPGTESSPVCGDLLVIQDPDQVPNSVDDIVIQRPCGSVSGLRALRHNPELDFARSSVYLGANPLYADLYFIPALTDGLSYIVDDTAGPDIRSLDIFDLQAIYTCTDTRGYHPKLPQAGSGTRQFFLDAMGLTTPGPCVEQNMQTNDPSPVDGDPLALMPFSTTRYMNNPSNPANPPRTIVDIAATAPTAGVFYIQQTIYNVVRKADYDAPGSPLPAIFGQDIPGTPNTGGYLCDRFANIPAARQGFRVAVNCGL